jgi:hypothetical protein
MSNQNCICSMTMTCQYAMKPPCAAIRATKCHGTESKRSWICSWGVHKILRVVAEEYNEQVANQPYPRHV